MFASCLDISLLLLFWEQCLSESLLLPYFFGLAILDHNKMQLFTKEPIKLFSLHPRNQFLFNSGNKLNLNEINTMNDNIQGPKQENELSEIEGFLEKNKMNELINGNNVSEYTITDIQVYEELIAKAKQYMQATPHTFLTALSNLVLNQGEHSVIE